MSSFPEVNCHVCFAFPHRFQCNICAKTILCNHQGKKDVLDHLETTGHKSRTKASQSQTKINDLSNATSNDSLLQKTTSAEVTMSVLTVTENISLAFHEQLSPAICPSFSDSPTASKYRPRATKATCMLTLSRRRPLSYRNQSIDLRSKSMDWFLYDNGLRLERVKRSSCTLSSDKSNGRSESSAIFYLN